MLLGDLVIYLFLLECWLLSWLLSCLTSVLPVLSSTVLSLMGYATDVQTNAQTP